MQTMATSAAPMNRRDKLWLAWSWLSILIIIFIDGLPFLWPARLYEPKGSPFHVLQQLRDYDISAYNDPLIQEHMAPNYMPFLFAIEIGFQLPVVIFTAYRFSGIGKKTKTTTTTTGSHELLLLVYAFETLFSTVLCMTHVFYIDPNDFSPEQRDVYLYQLMAPWVAVPTLMFIDMYWRLYNRVSCTNIVAKKNQ